VVIVPKDKDLKTNDTLVPPTTVWTIW